MTWMRCLPAPGCAVCAAPTWPWWSAGSARDSAWRRRPRTTPTRVLQIDPDYVDAKLIVGVYEYVVGALPWPFKLMIGFAGITGSKSTGLAMLEDAGKRGVITSVESRTVIALFLRREARYKEAIEVVRELKREYPRDFLFCLEEANLRRDAGEGMVAVDAYRELLADASRPGYFASSKLELAYFGYGDALRGQRHYEEAAQAFERAAGSEGVGSELKIRSLLDAGECHDLMGERASRVARLPGSHRRRAEYLAGGRGKKVPAHALPGKLRGNSGVSGAGGVRRAAAGIVRGAREVDALPPADGSREPARA